MDKLWLCGEYEKDTEDGPVWGIKGIYDTKEKATEACLAWNYFIAPFKINEPLSNESGIIQDVEYPIKGDDNEQKTI